ncbi:hypothetical protein W97_09106 [Coniosporium apollinis CBS 100218]|uniref:F-box domain-containing protein n=1 Tax=Coniosporium apollinis (strain CBS 100218) TaxID=1168221 RepID=R7Z6V7_CONA1|nr:uncharacterized protein W97_09106 [Coniosporium apollinis CBS 100218]EON69843.1 hypothetical protein W97_09106 [Coniosporium apollinis CBS 100218]
MSSSVHHAFSVIELVALILLQLPLIDLFRVQRVCSRWRNIVQTFRSIQQVLFLRGLNRYARPSAAYTSIHKLQGWFHKSGQSSVIYAINPLIKRQGWSCDHRDGETEVRLHQQHWFLNRRSYDRPNASWRGMFVTQPPTKRLKLYRVFRGGMFYGVRGNEMRHSEEFVDEGGITLGFLAEKLEELVWKPVRAQEVERKTLSAREIRARLEGYLDFEDWAYIGFVE